MASHESSICPRCGSEFECKVGSLLQCQCAAVELTDRHREYIAAQFDDCLCATCLVALREEYDNRPG